MRYCLVLLLFLNKLCLAQSLQGEVMVSAYAYNGDLTKGFVTLQSVRPGINLNLVYYTTNLMNIRFGVGWANIEGNDKYNKTDLKEQRNLNFKSSIWEANLCGEFNVLDPLAFYAYPYIFAGVGVFHFNPYTYDDNNVKTYLKPLSTEGQGLPQYPQRKEYALTQFNIPFGIGWKVKFNEKMGMAVELGYRLLFTDYLDDVSDAYINSETLLIEKGPKAVELAYRGPGTYPTEGYQRGNPQKNDYYFSFGVKLITSLGKKRDKDSNTKK